MIKNSVPLSAIPNLSPEEKQNYTIGLLTSIDLSLKQLLVWAPHSIGSAAIDRQYRMEIGENYDQDFNFDLRDLNAAGVTEVVEKMAAAKPRAPRKAAASVAAVAPDVVATQQTTAPAETTLANAPVAAPSVAPVAAPVAAPSAAPSAAPEMTIDQVRNAATKFIAAITARGEIGSEVFSKLLKAQGVSVISALDKAKYPALVAEMAKIISVVAAEVFDPLK